jgi:hypothetical protein
VKKCEEKKFAPIFYELYNFLPKKMSLSSQKNGFGSEIRDPGVKKAPDLGSRIRIRNTAIFSEKSI